MKDKLVKFHHKRPYYIARRIIICSMLFLTLGTVVSIPTYITIKETFAKSEENKQEVTEVIQEKEVN